MAENAKMAFIAKNLVKLWEKYDAGNLTAANAEQIMDLEALFYKVQGDELTVREEYLQSQIGIIDSAVSYVPVIGNYTAKKTLAEVINLKQLGQTELNSMNVSRKPIYAAETLPAPSGKIPDFNAIATAEIKAMEEVRELQVADDLSTKLIDPSEQKYQEVKRLPKLPRPRPLNTKSW